MTLFALTCRELLTPQQHYDWGLRALKTILRGCGTLLQNVKRNLKDGGESPHTTRKGTRDAFCNTYPCRNL